MQEIVFGESLSWDFAPSIQNLLRILGTLTGQAARLAPQICSRFHGRAPREDEIMFLLMNG
jgi:hypothetical protein